MEAVDNIVTDPQRHSDIDGAKALDALRRHSDIVADRRGRAVYLLERAIALALNAGGTSGAKHATAEQPVNGPDTPDGQLAAERYRHGL